MNANAKPIIALVSGLFSLGLVSQPIQAQSGPPPFTGTATLADAFGASEINPANEDLTVGWSIVYNSGIYTYSYTIYNPAGDVLLNRNDTPTTKPEIVDGFSVEFDTTVPGAFIIGSQLGGNLSQENNGPDGLFWSFTAITAGNNDSFAPLVFQSYEPPTWGNANAQDANPPSPWSSSPFGDQVPVPNDIVPEPTTTMLFALGSLLPFGSTLLRSVRSVKKAGSSK